MKIGRSADRGGDDRVAAGVGGCERGVDEPASRDACEILHHRTRRREQEGPPTDDLGRTALIADVVGYDGPT